jgi:[acyl-carrier-protein] S-malonyltransferase
MSIHLGKTVFLFPGQGAQSVGMLSNWASEPVIRHVFDRASQVLGYDLWLLSQNSDNETLAQTHITQPLMLTAGFALWSFFVSKQSEFVFDISALAGHSLGEITALCAAGVFDFELAVALVLQRAQLMSDSLQWKLPINLQSHEGLSPAMCVVLGLDVDPIDAICREHFPLGDVVVTNDNAPGQVVIGGLDYAIERVIPFLKSAGAKRCLPLAMKSMSHTPILSPAADVFSTCVDVSRMGGLSYPLGANVSGQLIYPDTIDSKPQAIAGMLSRQMVRRVMWVDVIRSIDVAFQPDVYIEFSHTSVLSGLAQKILKNQQSSRSNLQFLTVSELFG